MADPRSKFGLSEANFGRSGGRSRPTRGQIRPIRAPTWPIRGGSWPIRGQNLTDPRSKSETIFGRTEAKFGRCKANIDRCEAHFPDLLDRPSELTQRWPHRRPQHTGPRRDPTSDAFRGTGDQPGRPRNGGLRLEVPCRGISCPPNRLHERPPPPLPCTCAAMRAFRRPS